MVCVDYVVIQVVVFFGVLVEVFGGIEDFGDGVGQWFVVVYGDGWGYCLCVFMCECGGVVQDVGLFQW